MSGGPTWLRVLSQPLTADLTRAQALLACDVDALYAVAQAVTAGHPLASPQLALLAAVREVLSFDPAELVIHLPPQSAAGQDTDQLTGQEVAAIADVAAVGQRGLIASTITNTLLAENWTVTLVEGGPPERFTGIEATRATEHLLVGVGYGEFIADEAGAGERGAIESLIEGLRETGCVVARTDAEPAGEPRRTLYALRGGPSLAHAIQSLLRREPGRPLRLVTG